MAALTRSLLILFLFFSLIFVSLHFLLLIFQVIKHEDFLIFDFTLLILFLLIYSFFTLVFLLFLEHYNYFYFLEDFFHRANQLQSVFHMLYFIIIVHNCSFEKINDWMLMVKQAFVLNTFSYVLLYLICRIFIHKPLIDL